jgi:predicted metal-dependent hydrolase
MGEVKSARINQFLEECKNGPFNPHYAGFFRCFNHQLFFEAHEVLEALWLKRKGEDNFLFYKGLIQLAGAFVHMQKARLKPAAALLRLARTNLSPFAPVYENLQVSEVLARIERWLYTLESTDYQANPLLLEGPPRLDLN